MTSKKKTVKVVGDVAYVPLTQGYEAIIDADDVPLVEDFNWHISSTGYAVRGIWKSDRSVIQELMHRRITDAPKGRDVDHVNHNRLDNRKSNLRVCSRSQNNYNRRINSNNTSGYKGVTWNKGCARWQAQMRINGVLKNLGYFETSEEANIAYQEASKINHGEYRYVASVDHE